MFSVLSIAFSISELIDKLFCSGEDKSPSVDIQLRLRYVGFRNANLKNNSKPQIPSSITNKGNNDIWGRFADFNIEDSHGTHRSVRFYLLF